MALNCVPACDESLIVFSVSFDMQTNQPQGDIFDPRDLHIAVKSPRSGSLTYYKTNPSSTDHKVKFTVITEALDSSWTEGVPSGYTVHDCEGSDGKPAGLTVICRVN